MLKRSIHQEDIIIEKKIYVPNIRAPSCINHKLTNMKGEIANNTIM